jgi:hypothetical protein
MALAWFIFDADNHRKCPLAAWLPDLLGRAAQSSHEAAPQRAKGAGLYGEGADRATLHPPPDGLSPHTAWPFGTIGKDLNNQKCSLRQ